MGRRTGALDAADRSGDVAMHMHAGLTPVLDIDFDDAEFVLSDYRESIASKGRLPSFCLASFDGVRAQGFHEPQTPCFARRIEPSPAPEPPFVFAPARRRDRRRKWTAPKLMKVGALVGTLRSGAIDGLGEVWRVGGYYQLKLTDKFCERFWPYRVPDVWSALDRYTLHPTLRSLKLELVPCLTRRPSLVSLEMNAAA